MLETEASDGVVEVAGCGLRNVGNSCYANAVLQALTHTPPLAKFAKEKAHSRDCRKQGCALCLLEQRIARSLSLGIKAAADNPAALLARLRTFAKGLLVAGRQEDAHELLRHALEACQKAVLPQNVKDAALERATPLGKFFAGVLQSQVLCMRCGHESNTLDNFMDLSIDLIRCNSVEAALAAFTRAEKLDGDNAYRCEGCRQLCPAKKQFTVRSAPSILVLHLKRFGALGGKINRHVAFSEQLDMTPYMTPGCADSNPQYSLYASLVHFGTAASGHYYCYARDRSGWLLFDDCSVSRCTAAKVLAESAYMLFYTRTTKAPICPGSPKKPTAFIGPQLPAAVTNGAVNGSAEVEMTGNGNHTHAAPPTRKRSPRLPRKAGAAATAVAEFVAALKETPDVKAQLACLEKEATQSLRQGWRDEVAGLMRTAKRARPDLAIGVDETTACHQLIAAVREKGQSTVSAATKAHLWKELRKVFSPADS
eukprot:jgi/Chlat1/6639/Chrsp49S09074